MIHSKFYCNHDLHVVYYVKAYVMLVILKNLLSKICYYFFLYAPFPILLPWKSNTIFHLKVKSLCFIFSFDDLNEWICLTFTAELTLHGLHRCFRMWPCVLYFVLLILPLHFQLKTVCLCLGISKVCLWIWYVKVV